jgi:hypothetical protein
MLFKKNNGDRDDVFLRGLGQRIHVDSQVAAAIYYIAPGFKQISDLDFLQWDGKEKDFFG